MVSLVGSKVLLALSNFLLLVAGSVLISGGVAILCDPDRVLLSKLLSQGSITTLPHPLLYYMAIGFATIGFVLSGAGFLGCWASCMDNFFMLSTYFIIILVVLVLECALYAAAWSWHQCLGLGVSPDELIKDMQRDYGRAGDEQFTAAIDLAQTLFHCCGISSSIEYDTSLWRLQELGPRLAVPLTCCKLENLEQMSAYLSPKPLNASLCQALEPNRHQGYRHSESCGGYLEDWFKEQYIIFLAIGLVVVVIEFLVLLCTILMCTNLYKHNHSAKHITRASEDTQNCYPESNTIYLSTRTKQSPSYSNKTYTLTSNFPENYKLTEKG